MASSEPSWLLGIVALFALKILMIPCYFSTDFDVHRNWLAITSNLSMDKWYTDETSEWTLDYPPFFAWFQLFLAQGARWADPGMLTVQTPPYFSAPTLVFQRLSVIFGDLFLVFSTIQLARELQRTSKIPPKRTGTLFGVLLTLIGCNVGLLLVDSIHFQYNGFLTGILLISMKNVLRERYMRGAFWYFVLINFKHIYLYLAPAYLAFYVRNYCLTERSRNLNLWTLLRSLSGIRVLFLFIILFLVMGVSFGPFLFCGQFFGLLERLFPFRRGLTHAYWAPNFWSLYNMADFTGLQVLKRLAIIPRTTPTPGYTSGLVEEYSHALLPCVTPFATFLLTVMAMLPFCLIVTLSPKRPDTFLRILTVCGFCSYLFGWHVHEKAILLVTIPMTILAAKTYRYARVFLILSTLGHFSLFPLFITGFETPIKYLLVIVYFGFSLCGLSSVYKIGSTLPFLRVYEAVYLLGLVPLELYCSYLHYFLNFDSKAPFVPLLATSVYCSIGIFYCWILFSWNFFCDELSLDIWWHKKGWAMQQSQLKTKLVVENIHPWQDALMDTTQDGAIDGGKLRLVGGLDISTPDGDDLNACVCLTLLKYPQLEVIHSVCEPVVIDKPYIAGFLAFREVGPMVDLVKRVGRETPEMLPQVLLIDGNGILHPRGFGLASHVGILLGIPTVGVAKNLHLVSGLLRDIRRYEEELVSAGQTIPLKSMDGSLLGCALRPTQESKNPVFVSVGHNISLETAVSIVISCSKYRVPEPIRQADQLSRKMVQLWF